MNSESPLKNLYLAKFVDALCSMRLTVICLAATMVLVTVGTFAQIHYDLQIVQRNFFNSFLVWWPFDPQQRHAAIPIFPGGHLLGAVLVVNLIAAHLRRFRWTWKNLGIHLTHGGLIIMLLGGLFTDLFAIESSMRLTEGETKNYTEDARRFELAVIDQTDAETDTVTAIPVERLKPGHIVHTPNLPFSIAVRRFYPNSRLAMLSQSGSAAKPAATQGIGAQIVAEEAPLATGVNERNTISTIVELIPNAKPGTPSPASLGTLLVSDALGAPQGFSYDGKQWSIKLRPVRYYKPYSLKLKKFSHDRYAGTEIAKNFSSAVLLMDDEQNTRRDVLIYMNHPLRYRGDTYYQAGFQDNDTTTILQVVHNPAVVTPYLACVIVSLGLLFQFGSHLIGFSRRMRKTPASISATV